MSEQHRAALDHLDYGVTGGGNGFVLLTGDVGTGKTTICRTFLERLPPKTEVVLILNPVLTLTEFLQTICDELDLVIEGSRDSNKTLIDHLNRFLLQVYAVGHKTILIVDEAQNLTHELLEQIRLLTNLESDTDKLLQIFLIGQPELREMLERPDMLQVSQRITSRYHLGPLDKNETRAYIERRLEVAGAPDIQFTPSAIRGVYAFSKGVPRLINVLCDKALLSAYQTSSKKIDAKIIQDARRRVTGDRPSVAGRRGKMGIALGAAAVLAAIAFGTAYWLNVGNLEPSMENRLTGMEETGRVAVPAAKAPIVPRTLPATLPPAPAPAVEIATSEVKPSAPSVEASMVAGYGEEERSLIKPLDPVPFRAESAGVEPTSVEPVEGAPTVADIGADPRMPVEPDESAGLDTVPPLTLPQSSASVTSVQPTRASIDKPSAHPADEAQRGAAMKSQSPVNPTTSSDQAAPVTSGSTDAAAGRVVSRTADSERRTRPKVPAQPPGEETLDNYTRRYAERKLLSMWGVDDPQPGGRDFCESAPSYGLNCLKEASGLEGLLRYDRPAILYLTVGEVSSYAVVLKASEKTVALDVLERKHVVPAHALADVWDGEFLLLWKKSGEFNGNLVLGAKGQSALWLRDAIDQIDGKKSAGDVYDETLVARVKEFQRASGLTPDGIVGPRTFIVLQNRLADKES
ncbi:MAG: AAA family ATPase [Sedimenticolaceae bacterium]